MARSAGGRDPEDHRDAAVVEQLLRKLRPFDPVRGRGHAARVPGAEVDRSAPRGETTPAGVWARVGLGVLVGAALSRWPYARACDWALLFYLTAVATVIVTGVWGALFSWRSRLGLAHVVALGTVLWGLVLTTDEVLQRVGYARTAATWRCAAPPPSAFDRLTPGRSRCT